MTKKFKVNVGDNVAYSVQFLKSIGMSHSDMAKARGTIEEIIVVGDSLQLAVIKWYKETDMPSKVNVQNLAKVGPNLRFCQG